MTRTILSMIAAAVAAVTCLPQSAKACISCEHVPEVVRGHRTSDPPQRHRASPQHHNRVAVETRQRARASREAAARSEARREAAAEEKAKARIAADRTRSMEAKKHAARQEAAPNKETERTGKTASAPRAVVAQAKAESVEQKVASDSAPGKNTERSANAIDCKRFVPAAGLTVSVPCS